MAYVQAGRDKISMPTLDHLVTSVHHDRPYVQDREEVEKSKPGFKTFGKTDLIKVERNEGGEITP